MSTLGCTSAERVAGGPEAPGTPEFCISTERRVCHPPPRALPPGPALRSELLPGQGGGRGPQGPKAWAAVWSTHRQGDSCRRGEHRGQRCRVHQPGRCSPGCGRRGPPGVTDPGQPGSGQHGRPCGPRPGVDRGTTVLAAPFRPPGLHARHPKAPAPGLASLFLLAGLGRAPRALRSPGPARAPSGQPPPQHGGPLTTRAAPDPPASQLTPRRSPSRLVAPGPDALCSPGSFLVRSAPGHGGLGSVVCIRHPLILRSRREAQLRSEARPPAPRAAPILPRCPVSTCVSSASAIPLTGLQSQETRSPAWPCSSRSWGEHSGCCSRPGASTPEPPGDPLAEGVAWGRGRLRRAVSRRPPQRHPGLAPPQSAQMACGPCPSAGPQ